jgi:N-acetylneuraminate synthase/sialic acid synthase
MQIAKQMIDAAADCGVQAVKLQKRFNKSLYVKDMFNKPYENENSFGKTYGEHREALEFNKEQYKELMKYAESKNLVFLATAFDFESVDFLEDVGIPGYKIASGDITNYPLLVYISSKKKPCILSTGASTMEEVKSAYKMISRNTSQVCIMQCTAGYPVEDYNEINLNVIKTYMKEFPEAVIGYSGHESGIVLPVVAYVLGALVIEKHFTLSRSMKGTDHRFSLEPTGLRKLVRDLGRTRMALGNGEKKFYPSERDARRKMGKSIVLKLPVKAGTVLTREMVTFKSPGDGILPSELDHVLGKTIIKDLHEDTIIVWQHIK